ncbi:hypothetical protein GFS31_02310 [Leptolyngbya sp. BL0902]|uniref:hypothetical protein n=1 Tax=Leptolyngbya sp. BL0902 TaxID=1115757 RepID=UPI0018E76B7F|nr:hypothetical protein [Leptolyngbya sp. BL0902]QQE63564.1 hypothetical protein GFS31_02310 [Leptolyngbya sp. BL0902]
MADHTSSLSIGQRIQAWGQIASQVIGLRLALAMGLLAFVFAVSLDSAGNAAEAADLASPAYYAAPMVMMVEPQSDPIPAPDFDLENLASSRLRHGLVTSAILTSNRLTEAHLFTDLTVEK